MGAGHDLAVRFWNDVKAMGGGSAALDYVINTIDDRLLDNQWDAVSTLLRAFEPSEHITSVTLTVLVSSHSCPEIMLAYGRVRAKAREHFIAEFGLSRANDLLQGL